MGRFEKRPDNQRSRGDLSRAAENALWDIVEDLENLQQNVLRSLQDDVKRLEAEKTRLANDIQRLIEEKEKLQQARQITEQQVLIRQLAEVLAKHISSQLQSSLKTLAIGSIESESPERAALKSAEVNSTVVSDLNENVSKMLDNLDDTVTITFSSLQQELKNYQSHLSQQLLRMYDQQQQGEEILAEFVNRLRAELEKTKEPTPLKVVTGGMPTVLQLTEPHKNGFLEKSPERIIAEPIALVTQELPKTENSSSMEAVVTLPPSQEKTSESISSFIPDSSTSPSTTESATQEKTSESISSFIPDSLASTTTTESATPPATSESISSFIPDSLASTTTTQEKTSESISSPIPDFSASPSTTESTTQEKTSESISSPIPDFSASPSTTESTTQEKTSESISSPIPDFSASPSTKYQPPLRPNLETTSRRQRSRSSPNWSPIQIGFLLVVSSTVMSSLYNVAVKALFNQGSDLLGNFETQQLISPTLGNIFLILMLRLLVVVPLMLLLAPILHPPVWQDLQNLFDSVGRNATPNREKTQQVLWLSAVSGGFLFLSQVLIYIAIGNVTTGVAIALFFIYPMITGLLAWFLFRERPNLFTSGAISSIFCGQLLILGSYSTGNSNTSLGIISGIMSGIAFAVYVILTRLCAPKLHPVSFALINFATMLLLSFICLMIPLPSDWSLAIRSANVLEVILSAFMLGVLTLCGYLFNNFGIRKLGGPRSAIIGAVVPVLTVIFAGLIIQEKLDILQILGVLLVTGGAVAVSFEKMRSQLQSSSPKS
ncbi:EamA family transporter [Sphaerospermopsis aphanizomenoides BCCUSP55]|uniref:DMT family transporter n=1 Tax=Sphaerospermopsis aphanizomenoides TaxID=459663 RepID=UPI001905BFE0|nr:DMT family transporter [Sphaerospermopsis aphanizomenoides]MBK1986430.1 EamA family transporter [Sphaerospermopsis aphanizomenoides BCCUSP55]